MMDDGKLIPVSEDIVDELEQRRKSDETPDEALQRLLDKTAGVQQTDS